MMRALFEHASSPGRLAQVVWYLFLGAGAVALLATPYMSFREFIAKPVSIVLAVVLFGATVSIARSASMQSLPETEDRDHDRGTLAFIAVLAVGVLLRVMWVSAVPPVQLSDALRYVRTAEQLLETGAYFHVLDGDVLRAWRPPGYSFFLAGWMAMIGPTPWLPTITGLGLYLLTSVTVYSIARHVAGPRAALVGVVVLALWPSYIILTGHADSETLSLCLFIAIPWALTKAGRHGWWWAAIAGTLAGAGALVLPALLVLPVVWVLWVLVHRENRRRAVQRAAVAMLFMALTVAPWTARNYAALGAFVPVSTNGGSVFYRANNPLATGGYTRRGERDLDAHRSNEAVWNRLGFTWGIEWIKEHPLRFAMLSARKLMLLLGADDNSAYWALHRAYGSTGAVYEGTRLLSNLAWLAIWVLVIAGAVRARQFFVSQPLGALLLAMPLLLVAVHAVFESHARYHMPFIGILAVIAALATYPPVAGRES